MVKDIIYEKSKGKKCVEILVGNMWIPISAVDLRIMNRNCELVKVTEMRIRDLEKSL